VGSLGEVIAAELYGLELLPASMTTHDATAPDGRQVQIKLTQVKAIGIRSEPNHLIVLKLHPDGTTSEIYNGPGSPAWQAAGKMQNNGQRQISLAKLAKLMKEIPAKDRLLHVRSRRLDRHCIP